ncbi:hypothetical protein FHG87_003128 [Trinorchestia longiramus]|nr:hypothetical protein FHG87_003128 [Trinorchestia longiramus]
MPDCRVLDPCFPLMMPDCRVPNNTATLQCASEKLAVTTLNCVVHVLKNDPRSTTFPSSSSVKNLPEFQDELKEEDESELSEQSRVTELQSALQSSSGVHSPFPDSCSVQSAALHSTASHHRSVDSGLDLSYGLHNYGLHSYSLHSEAKAEKNRKNEEIFLAVGTRAPVDARSSGDSDSDEQKSTSLKNLVKPSQGSNTRLHLPVPTSTSRKKASKSDAGSNSDAPVITVPRTRSSSLPRKPSRSRPNSGSKNVRPTSGSSHNGSSSGESKPKRSSGFFESKLDNVSDRSKPNSESNRSRLGSGSGKSKLSSGSSKGRPSSGSMKSRPSSGSMKSRPSSGSANSRPNSGSVKSRPSSGSVKSRPSSGSVKSRPSSGSVKSRPSSGSVKPRPSSGSTSTRPNSAPLSAALEAAKKQLQDVYDPKKVAVRGRSAVTCQQKVATQKLPKHEDFKDKAGQKQTSHRVSWDLKKISDPSDGCQRTANPTHGIGDTPTTPHLMGSYKEQEQDFFLDGVGEDTVSNLQSFQEISQRKGSITSQSPAFHTLQSIDDVASIANSNDSEVKKRKETKVENTQHLGGSPVQTNAASSAADWIGKSVIPFPTKISDSILPSLREEDEFFSSKCDDSSDDKNQHSVDSDLALQTAADVKEEEKERAHLHQEAQDALDNLLNYESTNFKQRINVDIERVFCSSKFERAKASEKDGLLRSSCDGRQLKNDSEEHGRENQKNEWMGLDKLEQACNTYPTFNAQEKSAAEQVRSKILISHETFAPLLRNPLQATIASNASKYFQKDSEISIARHWLSNSFWPFCIHDDVIENERSQDSADSIEDFFELADESMRIQMRPPTPYCSGDVSRCSDDIDSDQQDETEKGLYDGDKTESEDECSLKERIQNILDRSRTSKHLNGTMSQGAGYDLLVMPTAGRSSWTDEEQTSSFSASSSQQDCPTEAIHKCNQKIQDMKTRVPHTKSRRRQGLRSASRGRKPRRKRRHGPRIKKYSSSQSLNRLGMESPYSQPLEGRPGGGRSSMLSTASSMSSLCSSVPGSSVGPRRSTPIKRYRHAYNRPATALGKTRVPHTKSRRRQGLRSASRGRKPRRKRRHGPRIKKYSSSQSLNRLGMESPYSQPLEGRPGGGRSSMLSTASSMSSLCSSVPGSSVGPRRSTPIKRYRHAYNRPATALGIPSQSCTFDWSAPFSPYAPQPGKRSVRLSKSTPNVHKKILKDSTSKFAKRPASGSKDAKHTSFKPHVMLYEDRGSKSDEELSRKPMYPLDEIELRRPTSGGVVRNKSFNKNSSRRSKLLSESNDWMSDSRLTETGMTPLSLRCDTPSSLLGFTRSLSSLSAMDSSALDRLLNRMCVEQSSLSVHDRRILQLLILKLQKRQLLQHRADVLQEEWRREKEEQRMKSAERWAMYRTEISKKREAENAENLRRWRASRESFLQSQENLVSLLRGKEERSREMLRRRDHVRVREGHVRRFSAEGQADAARHAARAEQVQKQGQQLLHELRCGMENKLQRAQQNLQRIQILKQSRLNEAKINRARRSHAAHAVQQQLEAALLHWRHTVLHKQLSASAAAEHKLTQLLQHRADVAAEELQARQIAHHQRYIREREREAALQKASRAAREVRDHHAAAVNRQKQSQMMHGRKMALTTAALRAVIRQELDPVSFDRSVARHTAELRLLGSPAGGRSSSSSHVFIG